MNKYIAGKILGALFGFMFAGPLGALIGLVVGHSFDKGMASSHIGSFKQASPEVREVFFRATFSVMGHMAKADGHVSPKELQLAREVMERMQLNHEQRLEAMRLFNDGKEPGFRVLEVISELKLKCSHPMMLRMFLDIQLQAALSDGKLAQEQYVLICAIASKLGLPSHFIDQMIAQFQAQQSFQEFNQQFRQSQSRYSHQHHSFHQPSQQDHLADAYKILGVQPSDSDPHVKRSYKKLMSQNHPDKLAANGLPPEMLKLATQKTQQIQQAYEVVCKARGI